MTENPYPPENEFIVPVSVDLYSWQRLQLHKYLNLHYLGDEDANEMDENKNLIAKYPEKETEEYKNAIAHTYTSNRFNVKVTYDVNGKPTLEMIENDY
jgi:hypothetical protein